MDSNLHTGPVATCGHSYSGTCPGLRFHVSGVAQVIVSSFTSSADPMAGSGMPRR